MAIFGPYISTIQSTEAPGDVSWLGPEYAGSDDDATADARNDERGTSKVSDTLRLLSFGFPDVPVEAPIETVTVTIDRKKDGMNTGTVRDHTVQLYLNGALGPNKAATAVNWPLGALGAASYTFNVASLGLTGASVQDLGFGVEIKATINNDTGLLYGSVLACIDYVDMTVTTAEGGSTTRRRRVQVI